MPTIWTVRWNKSFCILLSNSTVILYWFRPSTVKQCLFCTQIEKKNTTVNQMLANESTDPFVCQHPWLHHTVDVQGGYSFIKRGRGCSWEILKRNLKKYQDIVLWAWLEIFLTPKKPNLIQHIPSCSLLLPQYPKRYCKSSRWVLFEDRTS